jgi:tetratricopeptide (TPR) repeat protein
LGQSIEITRTTYKLENMCNAILVWSLAFMITAWISISFGSSSITSLFQIEAAGQNQGSTTSVLINNNNTTTKANTANNNLINEAIALLISGKYNEGIILFDKVLAVDPNNTLALTNKGTTLAYLQKYDEALSLFDKGFIYRAK